MTPATLALMTAVGPPDCATSRFPSKSAIVFKSFSADAPGGRTPRGPDLGLNRIETLPTAKTAVKRKHGARKHQKPSSKHQKICKLQTPRLPLNPNSQISKGKQSLSSNQPGNPNWSLALGDSLVFGAWCLVFLY